MKHGIISIFLLLAICSGSSIFAQKKSDRKPSSKLLETKRVKPPKTISGGVVNGKAIDLVAPAYPEAAKMVGIYGKVEVRVLIDTDGGVSAANVISGNPLLRSSSVKAALSSKFKPVKIGGDFVKVSGIIIYNFYPANWNWLEIGYSLKNKRSGYYSIQNPEKYFPSGFEEEIDLLSQPTENKEAITAFVIASIQSKLNEDSKSAWLFSVGLILEELNENCCRIEETQISADRIRIFIQTKPEHISPVFTANLEKLVFSIENPAQNAYSGGGGGVYEVLKNLEQNFPIFGK